MVRSLSSFAQPMSDIVLEYGFVEGERSAIVGLLRDYETGIGVSLCFQNFAEEVAGLPGDYQLPKGQMILARGPAGALVGCVCLRPVPASPESCELKRLYVRSQARGSGLGRRLTLAALQEARRLGYKRVCLDTLFSMREAQSLYRALGFRQTGIAASEPPVLLFECDLG